jgi:hypothetical protein
MAGPATVLDRGRLVVAHGGLQEAMHGRDDGAVRTFALYGAATGKLDAGGAGALNWAADYRGRRGWWTHAGGAAGW